MTKKSKTVKGAGSSTIITNRKARFDFFIEEKMEAGVVLEGWEVKSLRAGKVQLVDSYVILKNREAYMLGTQITPLPTASTHITPDPSRTRKLLLHRNQLSNLIGAVERKGYTLVALSLYWKKGKVKAEIGVGKGKQSHDKRQVEKDRDWQREKRRILKDH
ncbi:MAG: SsrA-binding protein SmpB [Gammaproteobacteria bacterium]|nr:SsrA-binding protein SmpB [Gammaproteobacteria bacterium]